MAHGGKRENAGRKPGSPNKVTADVRAAASEHGPYAIQVLVEIMTNENAPEAARIAAANAVLDRACGKPSQGVSLNADVHMSHDERVARMYEEIIGGQVADAAHPN